MIRRALRLAGWALVWLVTMGCVAWAFGALHYDFPVARQVVSIAFLVLVVAMIALIRGAWRKVAVLLVAFALVLCWWLTLKPSDDRQWQPDVAKTAWAEVKGDEVTIHNVRNCDYRTETDYTPHWETRTVRLSQITGMDIAINYWGSPWMAHPIVSFQFADGLPLCVSIETRKQVGEGYSAIGGIYRQYELIYIVADERDVLRVRTNFRKGEDVYLYRTVANAAAARERFLEYVRAMNYLHQRPVWYNAVTTNCTSAIRLQRDASERAPWDWRMLVNGKGDEMMYERGALVTAGLPFEELKRRALANPAAQAAGDAPDFSKRIRAGRPGFD